MSRLLFVLSLVLTLAVSAAAQPAPSGPRPTSGQIAEAVVAAVEAGEDPAQTLPADGRPDAWQVADELLRREQRAAAVALAAAVEGPGVAALSEYVTEAPVGDGEALSYAALERVREAFRARDFASAAAVEPAFPEPKTPVQIELTFARGIALAQLRRPAEAVAQLTAAGEAAEGLGWLVRAREAFLQAGNNGYGRIEAPRVVAAFQRAASLSERLEDRNAVARNTMNLGHALAMTGDSAASLEAYAKSLAIFRELGDDAQVASAIGMVATANLELGRVDDARAGFEEAIELHRRLGDRAGLGIPLSNLGLLLLQSGDPRAAIRCFEECVELSTALSDGRGLATGLLNLGLAQRAVGQVEASLGSYRKALELFDANGERFGASKTRGALARMHRFRAEYDEALALLERAHDDLLAIGATADAEGTRHDVGLVHLARGELADALAAFEQALASARARKRAGQISSILNSVGTVYGQMGDDARALAAFEEAWETAGELGTRINLGIQLQRMARFDEAEEHFRAVLEGATEAGQTRMQRFVRMSLGQLHAERGDQDAALAEFQAALTNAEADDAREDVVQALAMLAGSAVRLGRVDEADTAITRASELLAEQPSPPLEAHLHSSAARLRLVQERFEDAAAAALAGVELLPMLSSGLAEGEGAGLRESHSDLYGLGLAAAVAMGDTDLALRFIEHSRASSLREALGSRDALEAAVVPVELRRMLNDARAVAESTLEALRRAKKLKERREARDAYDAARTAVRDAVARIEREVKATAGVSAGVVDDLAAIRSRLAEDQAAVFYADAMGSLCALVVTAGEARIVMLGKTAAVDDAVAELRLEDTSADPAQAVAALRGTVVDPLGLAQSVEHVLISPAGSLAYLPFALLMPDRVVGNVPSGTVQGLLAGREAVGGTDVLAFGDPDYTTHAGAGRRLASLPGTRAEVEAIATVRHLGADATEAGFHAALEKRSRWRAVHLACHGLVDPERPMRSALALSPTETDDGQLTCFELFGTDLDADLVVLSACQTGKGRLYRAEGIVGLTGAFLHAGARGVVCSLWDVDDAATSALMTKFYELWNAPASDTPRPSAAEALRAAQAHVRAQEKWSHPAYWAPWVIWGGDR